MGRVSSVSTPSFNSTSSLLKIQILVVDDDSTSLAIVASMLKTYGPRDSKLELSVVTARSPLDALFQLRLQKGFFDLVVTDLYMPVMNGIELQQHVNEEFNLPVVIMSSDDKESVVMDCLESGATFYMTKPVDQNDLNNIWQCAVKSKQGKSSAINEMSANEGRSSSGEKVSNEDINSSSSVTEEGRECRNKMKRKGMKEDEDGIPNVNAPKKAKVVWTNSLHNRFLHAISHIGLDKAVPKKILEFMSVPGLTRENVASHLQKYRIFLKRVADRGNSAIAASNNSSDKALRSTTVTDRASTILRNLEQRRRQQQFPKFASMQKMGAPIQPGLGKFVSSSLGSSSFTSLSFPNHHQLPVPMDQQQRQTQPSLDKFCNNPSASGIADSVVANNNSCSYMNNGKNHYPGIGMIGDGHLEMAQKSFNAGEMSSGINGSDGFINWNCNDYSNVPSLGDGSFNYLVQTGSEIGGQFSASLNGNNPDSSLIFPSITEQQDGLGTGSEDMDFFNLINDGSALAGILNQQQLISDFDEILSEIPGHGGPYQQQAGEGFLNANLPASNSNQPEVSFPASHPYQTEVNNIPCNELLNPDSYQQITAWNDQPSGQVQGGEGMIFNGNDNIMDGYEPSFNQQAPESILDAELHGMNSADNATGGFQDWNNEFFNSLFDEDF